MKIHRFLGLGTILLGVGLLTWSGLTGWRNFSRYKDMEPGSSLPTPSWQAEPVVPTAGPATPTLRPAQMISTPEVTALASLPPVNALERFGVGVPYPPFEAEAVEQLKVGWYLTWQVAEHPAHPGGIEFWQMIRLREDGFSPDETTIRRVARIHLGATWLIGNEPDVIWQDNVTPGRYAEWYHRLYYLLKEVDPDSQIAIGGITQPTPLRLEYLNMVLSSYQTRYGEMMPVDIWNIHNFILREERDSWGVDIPPGLTDDHGLLYEIEDHDDLNLFKSQLLNFRRWMAAHGQRDKPLIVSEYGILMPEDYGFEPERVQKFLYGTYEFMLNTTDEQLGYPADGNRLVQRWAWYSLRDDRYPTGNFVDFTSGELTDLGKAHQKFVLNLP